MVYLSIGTNLGNKLENIKTCLALIEDRIGKIVKISSIFETEPWGLADQDTFYNLAIGLKTQFSPFTVLKLAQQIEIEMGRVKLEKWGARIIDIDILLYDQLIIKTQKLTIPHPFMAQRNFVLKPLEQIAPKTKHPVLNKSISRLVKESQDGGFIKEPDL